MDFIQKYRLLRRTYNFMLAHPTTLTREDIEAFIYDKSGERISRKTFVRMLDAMREIYACSIHYSNATRTYVIKR